MRLAMSHATPYDHALETLFAYLAETDTFDALPYDAVIGFGMFDLDLPRYCGDLYLRGCARVIVFTGGIGAGTGSLGRPEADAWYDEVRRSLPAVPAHDVIVENRSTNTAENVTFTARVLRDRQPPVAFGEALRRVLVVASPTRLRRVSLTLRHHHPGLEVTRTRPSVPMHADRALYDAEGVDYAAHVLGELDRLERYADFGWIVREPLPAHVQAARGVLRGER
jgi:hypothetical protein